jgi:peptidoglycan/LPS O-acetylase OafA/YrhL
MTKEKDPNGNSVPVADLDSGYRLQGFYRFILALMVVWSHSVGTFFPELPWFGNLQLGNAAVACFFVLSGYLMQWAIRTWYAGRLKNFIMNRYLRIAPPLFLAGIFSIMVHFGLVMMNIPLVGIENISLSVVNKYNAAYTLLSPVFPFNDLLIKMVPAMQESPYTFVRYSWAIFTELIFYWTILLYYVMMQFLPKNIVSILFYCGCIFMGFAGIVSYNNLISDDLVNLINNIPFISQLQWAPHFLLGVLFVKVNRLSIKIFAGSLPLIIAYLLSAIQLSLYAKADFMWVVSIYTLALIAGFSLILSPKKIHNFGIMKLDRATDQLLGGLSYPIYINQYAIALLMISLCGYFSISFAEINVFARVLMFLIFNLIVILLSSYLIKITDTLTDSLRDRIRGQKL